MKIPPSNETNPEQVCNVLSDTSTSQTGSEIRPYLRECCIIDSNPNILSVSYSIGHVKVNMSRYREVWGGLEHELTTQGGMVGGC